MCSSVHGGKVYAVNRTVTVDALLPAGRTQGDEWHSVVCQRQRQTVLLQHAGRNSCYAAVIRTVITLLPIVLASQVQSHKNVAVHVRLKVKAICC